MSGSKATGANGLIKRSVMIHGHATSVALEAEFWSALEAWAAAEGLSVPAMLARIDLGRCEGSLASAIRVAVLSYTQAMAIEAPGIPRPFDAFRSVG